MNDTITETLASWRALVEEDADEYGLTPETMAGLLQIASSNASVAVLGQHPQLLASYAQVIDQLVGFVVAEYRKEQGLRPLTIDVEAEDAEADPD